MFVLLAHDKNEWFGGRGLYDGFWAGIYIYRDDPNNFFWQSEFLLVRGGFSQKVAITMIWWGVYICSNAGGGVVDS